LLSAIDTSQAVKPIWGVRETGAGPHGRIFQSIDDVRTAVREFIARYNAEWLIEKNGYRSPAQMRAAWLEETFRRAA
jgi:hypothetical protein